ncbi:alpha/beta hydrolase fold domain-containing protein [Enterococcus pingfangensis]
MRYSAKFVKNVFKVINMKKLVGATMVDPPRRRHLISRRLSQTDIPQKISEIDGQQLITLFPKLPTKRHVLYLHGGGYALEASPFHKEIQERFVKRYNLKVSYFDYPLAPENTAEKTVPLTKKAFQQLAYLYPDDCFCLFGDSAGGGLAMSLAQHLRDIDLPKRPNKIALVSPWLDASLSDPRSQELQVKDVLLEKDLLAAAGENYAGKLAVTDPLVSPIYGNFDRLGELLVVAGTDEILYPDVLRLQERVEESQGTTMRLEVVADMMHDFVVYPLKESLPYVDQIGEFYQ